MKLGLAFLFPVLAAAFAPSVQQNRDFTCLSMADAPVGGIPRGVGLSLTGGPPVSKASLVDSQGAIKPFGTFNPGDNDKDYTGEIFSNICTSAALPVPYRTELQDFGTPLD